MKDSNSWFLGLEDGRQKILREDKWMLADAAFVAGKEQAAREIAEKFDSDAQVTVEQAVDAIAL